MKNKKVLVAMSGGVDSAVAALLLKQQGCDIHGVFMDMGDTTDKNTPSTAPRCYSSKEKDISDVKEAAKMLAIDLTVIDVKKEYKGLVLDYFRQEYSRGRTPNPCVVCNRFLKFGVLKEKAVSAGIRFDFFATGHYANVDYDASESLYLLKKGADKDKDQSYFLCMLTQKQLTKLILPLGNLTKKEVRSIAQKHQIPVSEKEESHDFLTGNRSWIFGNRHNPGRVLDKRGNIIGEHKGINHYTIGQRKGMGIAGGRPLYVIETDAENNRVVLGEKKDLYKTEFIASGINIQEAEPAKKPPLRCQAKIRYRHPAAEALLYPTEKDRIKVVFKKPQWAITPGQAVALYQKDRVLGGGFIESVL